jgi:ketosteroid isomerase-like protein
MSCLAAGNFRGGPRSDDWIVFTITDGLDRGDAWPGCSTRARVPGTLPYGGEFIGPDAFAQFFARIPGGAEVRESFDVHVDQVIRSADYLIARLTNTAVPNPTGKAVVLKNAWLFAAAGGRLVGAQLYADTAAVRSSAG